MIVEFSIRRGLIAACIGTGLAGILATAGAQDPTRGSLDVAEFTTDVRLVFPEGTDRWITLGVGLGGDYNDEAFDPENPGALSHVQIEPRAYDFYQRNGYYADGTMLLLSFYQPQEKPEPSLQGFVQGDLVQQEIHVIDRVRFAEEGRGFFVFPPTSNEPASAMPPGSVCVQCHTEHGAFDGTFTQFYPPLR
jgi:hypothetical protein